MNRDRGFRVLLVAAGLALSLVAGGLRVQGRQEPAPAAVAPAARVWLGPDGQPLPFKNDEEVLEFLRSATVVEKQKIPVGITRPQRITLERNGVRARAVLRDVEEEKESAVIGGKRERYMRDSYIFECAAYELARLLGLDNVPPVVERRIDGKKGSVQLWLENAMNEGERAKQGVNPPDRIRWNKHLLRMRVFDQLIYNTDRNQGNLLIDKDWKLWMIDHTRAFNRNEELRDPAKLTNCERKLWERLQALDEAEVRQRLSPYLRPEEIRGLLQRRKRVISYLQKQLKERGEGDVLFSID